MDEREEARRRGPRSGPAVVVAALLLLASTCTPPAPADACAGLGALCVTDPETLSWALDQPAGSFADVDGDGVLDSVMASRASGVMVAWGEAPGDAVLHLLPGGAVDARAADVDGDGDLDVVIAGDASPQLRVLDNRGSRSLVESTTATLAGAPGGLWIGPLRPGADPRVVVTTRSPGGMQVLDRRLAPIAGVEVARSLGAFAAEDLDGDAAIDFVAVDGDDHAIRVIRSDGADGLTASPRIASAPAPEAIDLADLDGDGHVDALVTGDGGGVVWIHRGDGAGGFAEAAAITVADDRRPGLGVAGVSAKDGAAGWVIVPTRENVIAAEIGPQFELGRRVVSDALSRPTALRRLPEGIFSMDNYATHRLEIDRAWTFVEVWRDPAPEGEIGGLIAAGDLDHAHDVDLALVRDTRLVIYRAAPEGGWIAGAPIELSIEPATITAADVTGDGHTDLILGVPLPSPAIVTAIGDGAGDFTLGPLSPVSLDPQQIVPIARAGLGRSDVAIADGAPAALSGVRVLGFDAGAAVIDDTPVLADTRVLQVRAADVDGDGHDDLVATAEDAEDGILVVLRATGDGDFEAPQVRSIAPLEPPEEAWLRRAHLVVGDLDGDDRVDALLTGSQHTLRVFDLEDLATSATVVDDDTGSFSLHACVLADADEDADLDVICGGRARPLLLRDPAAPAVELVFGHDHWPHGPSTAAFADAAGAPRIAQIEGRGLVVSAPAVAPSLEIADLVRIAEPMRRIAIGDLDGDARLDVAAIAYDRIAALWSPGPAATVPGAFEFNYELTGLTLADLDGDGDQELIVGGSRVGLIVADVDDGHLAITDYLHTGLEHTFAGVPLLARADGPADVLVVGRARWDDVSGVDLLVFPRAPGGGLAETPVLLWKSGVPAKKTRYSVGDFDGDRFGDVAIFFDDLPPISIVWGSASRLPIVSTLDLEIAAPRSLGAADLDGDGRDELLVEDGGRALTVAFADRAAGAPRVLAEEKGVGRPLFAADLDGDGATEVIRVLPRALQILRGPVLSDTREVLLPVPVEDAITDVAAADLDGDGIRDVAANFDGALRIWYSTGSAPIDR